MEKPNVPQKSPYALEMDVGKYAWCSCGRSENQPFCDGSHRGTDFSPTIVEITEKKTVYWCGCKATQNKPFCDGSHGRILE